MYILLQLYRIFVLLAFSRKYNTNFFEVDELNISGIESKMLQNI